MTPRRANYTIKFRNFIRIVPIRARFGRLPALPKQKLQALRNDDPQGSRQHGASLV